MITFEESEVFNRIVAMEKVSGILTMGMINVVMEGAETGLYVNMGMNDEQFMSCALRDNLDQEDERELLAKAMTYSALNLMIINLSLLHGALFTDAETEKVLSAITSGDCTSDNVKMAVIKLTEDISIELLNNNQVDLIDTIYKKILPSVKSVEGD